MYPEARLTGFPRNDYIVTFWSQVNALLDPGMTVGQSKRVEHGVLSHLMGRYHDEGAERFLVRYRPTVKNEPSARVFDDLGFEVISDDGDTRLLGFDISDSTPPVELLTVVDAS